MQQIIKLIANKPEITLDEIANSIGMGRRTVARDMLYAVEKNKVKHQIGFNYRFVPAIQLAKKLIDQGKIGKIYHFRAQYLQDWIVDPDFPLVWRLDKNIAGSGSHGDLGAHLIGAARYLVGEFDRVIGIGKTFIKERPLVNKMIGLSGKAREGIHPYMSAWWPPGHVIGYEHTFVHELYEFVEAIANDK